MMRAFSLAEVSQWLGLPAPAGGERRFSNVSTDTRALRGGDLFVALRGDNFDGHQFLATAAEAGAVAAVVDSPRQDLSLPQLVVADTRAALARLALGNRLESTSRCVAVTGSNGKTTVKEMLAAILSAEGPTLATTGNLNNDIGVPLTLFRLAPEHRFAVIELGASALGEIAHTVAVARPDVAIITNAGDAHIEGFGSYRNIVLGKGEIIDGVPAIGTVVLNQDDPAFGEWRRRAGERRVVSVSAGGSAAADLRCESIASEAGGQVFSVAGEGWQGRFRLRLPGLHNITNALLALAASRALGAGMDAMSSGLEALEPVSGRLQEQALTPELTLIDDSYNANPASMKAALGVLASHGGLRVAVLGAMAELGPEAATMHRDVGAVAASLGTDRLLVVGEGCQGYGEGFGSRTEFCASHQEAVDRLLSDNTGPMTILVKGSRSSAMDRVVEGIKEKVQKTCCSG